MATFDAEAARRGLRRGERRDADRPGRDGLAMDTARRIGVAPLPGSERVYDPARKLWEDASPPNDPSDLPFGGGWLVGVVTAAPRPRREAAIDFARYLIGPEAANRVRADRAFPMLPVRGSKLGRRAARPACRPRASMPGDGPTRSARP